MYEIIIYIVSNLLHLRCSDVALGLPCNLGAWHCPGGTACVVVTQGSENYN